MWGAGRELTRGDIKRGEVRDGRWCRTPLQVLQDAVETGCTDELHIWHEWEKATKGKRLLVWSRGLRKRLLGDEAEKTDEEATNAEVGGEVVADLDSVWSWVRHRRGLALRLLVAAESGGIDAVLACLQAEGSLVPRKALVPQQGSPP